MSYGIAKQTKDGSLRFFDAGEFIRDADQARSFATRREAIFVARTISSPTLALDLASNVTERADGSFQLNCPADSYHMVLVNHGKDDQS